MDATKRSEKWDEEDMATRSLDELENEELASTVASGSTLPVPDRNFTSYALVLRDFQRAFDTSALGF